MFRRAARARVVVLFALFGLAGFWYEWTAPRSPAAPPSVFREEPSDTGSLARFPDAATAVAAAPDATANALAAEQQSVQVAVVPPPTEVASSPAGRAAATGSSDCAWPAIVQDLNPDAAQSSCRPFVGLLVPCTSAKTCDRSGRCWKTVDDTSLLKELAPSIFSTLAGCACDCQVDACRPKAGTGSPQQRAAYDLVIYIGYDGNDAIYDTDTAREQLPERFKAALRANTKGGFSGAQLPRIGLRLVRCADSRSMVANSNCLTRTAHTDGAEYTYRVNDDTVFETPGWLETLPDALQSLDPPNVGVAGPRATGGNQKILTYDMVHRSHMEIFAGNRYPPSLQNWYSDDWITKVYSGDHSIKGRRFPAQDCGRVNGAACGDFKQGRMVMLAGTSVKHTRTVDHTRYMPDHNGKDALPQLLEDGSQSLAKFLSKLEHAVSVGNTQSAPPAASFDGMASATKTPVKLNGVEKDRSRAPAIDTVRDTDLIERAHGGTSDKTSKTAAAIAAFGHCPDGKWELRGGQLVCPSAEAAAAAGEPTNGAAVAEDSEDEVGYADERLSTRLDPNGMRSVCQLPAGRAQGLTAEQHGRLRSDWCKTTATYRRQLPSGGASLSAALHAQDTVAAVDGQANQAQVAVIRARCATGELRWTDQGRAQQYAAAAESTHSTTWRSLPRAEELVLPFSGGFEYVEVVCTLPQKSTRPSATLDPIGAAAAQASNKAAESVDVVASREDYPWAAREVFMRFAPAPEYEAAPALATSVGGTRVGPDGLNIVVLMVDSLSRAQAMAFLPKLRRLLQETAPADVAATGTSTNTSSHSSYVFDHAGTVGAHSGTNSNMGALFAGRKYNFVRDDAARVATLVTPWTGTHMLWDDLAEQGYVTAAAFPFGDLWGAAYWNSTFHHLAPSKYGARGSSFADHDQVLESWERGEPFCVGGQLSSDLDAVWIDGFLHAYPARKKFVYAHFIEGHNAPEATAQLDANLVRLVRSAMSLPHTAVYVASDHGGVPRDLPLSALFLPKEFLAQHADVSAALRANEHQYITHYDMRRTLRHLSLWPELPPDEPLLPEGAASLLGPLGARRDCRGDIGDGHCICRQWTTCVIGCTRSAEREAAEFSNSARVGSAETEVLERPDSEAGSAAAKLAVRRARQTAEKVLSDFNSQLLGRTAETMHGSDPIAPSSCRTLSLGSLTHVRTQQLSEQRQGATLVYVEFSVRESTYARFFASASFGRSQPAAGSTTETADAPMAAGTVESSGQLTTYQPFRACADARLPLPFCVCKDL